MTMPLNRRSFVLASTAGAAAISLPRFAIAGANSQVRVGVIGVAGRGASNLAGISAAGAKVVALCDVDEPRAAQARKQFPDAKFTQDFRTILDRKDIDAVVVSTPDHTHFPAAALAMDAGLHVYCEKPLAHTVAEARILNNLAKAKKRVTQMGTQVHAENNYRRVVELIRAGAIGTVKEAHVWCAKSWGGEGKRPTDTPEVPKGLDYDLWVGPAPMRPYHKAHLPFEWRRWWDFGAGTLGDMGCHYLDLAFWALNLDHPTHVSASGSPVQEEMAAKELTATWKFPKRGERAPVTLSWYDGGRKPKVEGMLPWNDGVLFVGEKGMLQSNYGQHSFIGIKAEEAKKGLKIDPIAASPGHYVEFVKGIQGEVKPLCSFDYSGLLTEMVLLGVAAYRAGTPFNWDGKAFRADQPKVTALLTKKYREPWGSALGKFMNMTDLA